MTARRFSPHVFLFLAGLAAALWLLPPAAQADLNITVAGGQIAAQPIAVVPFSIPPDVSFDVAQVIQDDLKRSGLFNPLPRAQMLEKPTQPGQLDYRNWRVLGQNDVVIGQVRHQGAGIGVRFYLFDVFRGQQLIAYDMPPVAADQLRYTAHRIADLIFKQLTGIPGYFDTRIAYVQAQGLGAKRTFKIMISDSDGRYPHVVASYNEPLMSPAWSPDGKALAFVGFERTGSAIYIDDLSTGHLTKLTGEPGINGAPAWSPDGKSLAITLSFGHNPDLYIVNLGTHAMRRLTHDPAIDTEATWSPDGKTIAFTSDRGGNAQIYEVPADGSAPPTRITFQGKQNLRARFAPDGRSLALVNYDGSSYRIGVLDLQTGNLKLLTDGPLDQGPDWAPNGHVLIYDGISNNGTQLKI
ncbi:MAG: Tol-Pal system beta propeller repeat protein TolB, partial [Gammaproteobacteria bacterium]|nr:Tol-Pal system beta propeller repeat protein TolB [Gammaproteobacteria bacterium]